MHYFALGKDEMNRDEYYAFRQFVGTLNTLLENEDKLKDRCKTVKNGWRDYQMIKSVGMKLYEKLWKTLPREQQKQCRKELDHSRTLIEVRKPEENEAPDIFTYIPQRPLERVSEKLIEYECKWCSKCGKGVNRCQTRKDLESLYNYPIHRLPDGSCPFQCLIEV